MAEKTVNLIDSVKAYPCVDVAADLPHKDSYQLNSWFYINRGECNGEMITSLYHAIYYQFPGANAMLVSSLSFTNETTGERRMESLIFSDDDIEMSEDKLYIKCPNAEVTGDINCMHVKAKMDDSWIDLDMVPVGYPLYNSRTGRYWMLGLDVHQYALPTMETTGKICVANKEYDFSGSTWLDRQWQIDISMYKSGAVTPPPMDLTKIPTWGWMSIQLDNGDKLSFWFPNQKLDWESNYGSGEQGKWYSWATVLHPDGSHSLVYAEPVDKEWGEWYHNEESPFTYPTKFTVRIPEYDAVLEVVSAPQDQEIRNPFIGSFDYYEGACKLSGTWKGEAVTGCAFLEMIGVWLAPGQDLSALGF